MIILGKVRPLSGRLLGPHPQVLIIARTDAAATSVLNQLNSGVLDGNSHALSRDQSSNLFVCWSDVTDHRFGSIDFGGFLGR
ncbi:hypothetical protein, partial [Mycobacteroides abscessus]